MTARPPTWIHPNNQRDTRPGQKGRLKGTFERIGRRDVLAQCQKCLVKGTARVVLGSWKSCTIPLKGQKHLGCDGEVVGYELRGTDE